MEYGRLKPEGHLPRIADGQLGRMLATFGLARIWESTSFRLRASVRRGALNANVAELA